MRQLLIASAFACLSGISLPAIAQTPPASSQVQIVTMGVRQALAVSMLEEPSDQRRMPVTNGFAFHDLSRRHVEFRMTEAFSEQGSAGPPVRGELEDLAPIASTSSIQVPVWMTASPTLAKWVAFTPRCTPVPYQPTTFLRSDVEARRARYYTVMSAAACEHGIPTGLFDAMIIQESGYNPAATSAKNAVGFAQLMSGTAIDLGVDRNNPVQNMRGGARYLRRQLDHFGQIDLALAAYNAGPARIRGRRVPVIAETQGYVANILSNWSRLAAPQIKPSIAIMDQSAEIAAASVFIF